MTIITNVFIFNFYKRFKIFVRYFTLLIFKKLAFLADLTAYDTIVTCLSVCPVDDNALRVGVGVASCTVVFLRGDFLFISSDTFAVCIVYPQRAIKLDGFQKQTSVRNHK